MKFAKDSEPVKAGYIEVALMLHRSVLSIPEVRKTLLLLDQQPVNAIDSVYKIREVAIQCDKKVDLQVWAFKMLADNWLLCDGQDPIPIRALKDGEFSLVRLYLWKRQGNHIFQDSNTLGLLHLDFSNSMFLGFINSLNVSIVPTCSNPLS